MRKTIIYTLTITFLFILLAMLYVTVTAAIDQNIFEGVASLWSNWWFKATLADAYFAFLTFFIWVAYKEIHLWRKLICFVSILLLGKLAISAYMLAELHKLQVGETFETLLTRRNG
jgi:hypothetical protein